MSLPSRAILASLVIVIAAPAAHAGGTTVGASFGKTEAKGDAADGDDANTVVGLFVRERVFRNLSVQAEVSKLETDSGEDADIRSGTLAAIVDLSRGKLVPFVIAGAGVDVISTSYSSTNATYVRGEIGLGLEYRFHGGFVLGADARIGTRTEDGSPQCCYAEPVAYSGGTAGTTHYKPDYVASSTLSEGEYRSMRVTLAVAF